MRYRHTRFSVRHLISVSLLLVLTAACNTLKHTTGSTDSTNKGDNSADNGLTFLRKVTDNAVYSRHINAKADVSMNGKSLPVSAQMQTTQGKMIRFSLSALGLMEVGRLEMTPADVLIIDRVHKQYARASYHKVKFMARNGLTFYTLEALLRNQLFLPGYNTVDESNIEQFAVLPHPSDNRQPVSISHSAGNMNYTWQANAATAQITQTEVVYHDAKKGNSTLQWQYSDFVSVGKKFFPTTHNVHINLADKTSKPKNMLIQLGKINTTTDYSAPTTPSSRYEEVDIDELFQSIFAQ